MVLIAANFKDHAFSASSTDALDDLVKAGFVVGAEVVLLRRITTEFGPKKLRKDLGKGTPCIIKGVADGKPVVRFTVQVGKFEHSADVAVQPLNLQLKAEHDAASAAVASHGPLPVHTSAKAIATYPFLAVGDGAGDEGVEVVGGWTEQLASNDEKYQMWALLGTVGFMLRNLAESADEIGEKDILVVRRKGVTELWTLRDFKAGSILCVPDTTDIKPRFLDEGSRRHSEGL